MLRDFKFLRRNSGKGDEEIENVPQNPTDLASMSTDPSPRPPLNTIQDPTTTPNPNPRTDRTPTKPKPRNPDSTLPLRTPDKQGGGFKHRFGWAQRNDTGLVHGDSSRDDARSDASNYSVPISRGGLPNAMTPRSTRTMGKGVTSSYSECNSTQSTPTKSVSKPPPSSGFRGKVVDGSNGVNRVPTFAALYRGVPGSVASTPNVVSDVEVPHFELKEDPSFWMDHNVQVLIRVRPLNSMERSTYGYSRCLRQDTAQTITWIGQAETRFTFDHVACETVDQEMLFRMSGLPMVENCLSGYNSCMFAYGQTGSGKTYTMLGEIEDLEGRPSPNRGMTPRIFEFLFARIQAEEESRRDERLKYNCKCSFLEIYNEQITDLLDPSSTNLLLREDIKKGVYVENLSEFEVHTVNDILKLLTQGSLNRKVAATNMNRESSRSHSVFTCVIESRWENDSTTNLRFARLNLVDLAGSERQKSSGAEGERLKEAANINKSLSTLGHVIMILVDVAQGRSRHVPYRDSRLTFLLQDSLGGNSKTMIIANVSPSIGCAAETLNTLKFAQRAKLIQNNAVVNEDSSGDVDALQHQIQLLKEELSALKRQNVSRSLSFASSFKDETEAKETDYKENMLEPDQYLLHDSLGFETNGVVRMSTKQLKSLETTLTGALRRERMAETFIKKLEAEIEHLNRLVRQREEDTRSTKMMLRFREDKIQRMESLVDGSLPSDAYLIEENKALLEEINILQAKTDKNPEVTRFALENIRLLEQLRRFQEFYEEGEREILLEEVSKLREQLLQFLDEKVEPKRLSNMKDQPKDSMHATQENNSLQLQLQKTYGELAESRHALNACLEENQKLRKEIQDLHSMLDNLKSATNGQEANTKDLSETPSYKLGIFEEFQKKTENCSSLSKHAEEVLHLQLELDVLKIMLKEERLSHDEVEERTMCLSRDLDIERRKCLLLNNQYQEAICELKEVKSVVEALESQQILAINEMDDLRKNNCDYMNLLSEKELEIMALREQCSRKVLEDLPSEHPASDDSNLQTKLRRMQNSLEKAKLLNTLYQSNCLFQASNEEEMDEICRQAEAETAEVIVCMQEELSILQQQVQDYHLTEEQYTKAVALLESELKEVQEKLLIQTEDNQRLLGELQGKDAEMRKLSEEWEFLASDLEKILSDEQEALMDDSNQLEFISSSFSEKRIWVSEQVGKLIRMISEKELLIDELRKCLEDANNKQHDVEGMLKSLRGAALVMNEAHQHECNEKEKEILFLKHQLAEISSTITELELKVKLLEDHSCKASNCATVAFVIVNRLSEVNLGTLNKLNIKDNLLTQSAESNLRKEVLLGDQAAMIREAEEEVQSLRRDLADSRKKCDELQGKLSEEAKHSFSLEQKLEYIEDNNILWTKEKLTELKTGVSSVQSNINTYVNHDGSPELNKTPGRVVHIDGRSGQTDSEENIIEDIPHCAFTIAEDLNIPLCDDKNDIKVSKKISDRDVTILLLKKEIESALESLKEVKVEIAKLRKEKDEIFVFEKQRQESLKGFTTQAIALEAAFSHLEKQFRSKMQHVTCKLQDIEQSVKETGNCWSQKKEFLEMEVGDATAAAIEKAAEASCILAKFEEAQDTVKEADIMINQLVIANEMMKLEVERLKKIECRLGSERDILLNEVDSWRSISNLKDQQLMDLEKELCSNLIETTDLVLQLEATVDQVKASLKEDFKSIIYDFQGIKTQIVDSGKLMHSWLEDVWSEIVVKECAVSVFHLCHTGILLEMVTGMSAENALLQHGLSESNCVIADLREHNSKSNRELQMCRTIRGKLLADIKSSFNRISRKEEETGELGCKLLMFEKKILDLQVQEEMMLQRSNSMGSELAILMRELEISNANVFESFLDHEKILQDAKDLLDAEAELLVVDLYSKDFESSVLVSQLENIAVQKVEAERKSTDYLSVLENLKTEVIDLMIDRELKDKFLEEQESVGALLRKDIDEVQTNNRDLSSMLNHSNMKIAELDRVSRFLQNELFQFKTLANKLQTELETKDAELTGMRQLEEESSLHRNEACKWKSENNMVLHDLEKKNSEIKSYQCHIDAATHENQKLHDQVFHLESIVSSLTTDLEMKSTELSNSQSVFMADLASKSIELEYFSSKVDELREEDVLLRNEIRSLEKVLHDVAKSSFTTARYADSVKGKLTSVSNVLNALDKEGLISEEICEEFYRAAKFAKEVEWLESQIKELVSENTSLRAELARKDDILNGLLFDLSLLQESASNIKDQKDEIEALEDELAVRSGELDEAVARNRILEAEIQEKMYVISALKSKLLNEHELKENLSRENIDLTAQIEESLAAKCLLEKELQEQKYLTDNLEMELSEMSKALGKMSNTTESLKSNLIELSSDRDQLHSEIYSLKQMLQKTEACAEENKAIALEAQQAAESQKNYAEEKEAEVKLLERSVEELEHTINALESKVDILKGEAERQRLQREELETELLSVKHQMQNVESTDNDMKRNLVKKKNSLEQAMKQIEILEKTMAERDAEICQLKSHISELNLHAEAQASEYKQKFKTFEAMAEQVKPEGHTSQVMNSLSNKSEKIVAKSRGSGSPFKCIGLGLAQQMKSEKDEELTAAKLRIEELESLAVNRQKEVFALNARLAAAESMTHDVIRDLLGVKLDMTNYASLLDDPHVQKIAEKAQMNGLEPKVKELEVIKLKKQLDEFVEERRGWLEEIDRKQTELVATQVALEKQRQRDQLLKSENDIFKMESVTYKKRVTELEGEVKQLSGQQNLQQRIHHHAKIKEENNALKLQNEELSAKLQRAQIIQSRIKEELAQYRASIGKSPYINFDEEHQLTKKLKESEDYRLQLAQKLVGLCTSILKAAGITKPMSNITPAIAEEALDQLKSRIASLEKELNELALKNKIATERLRLSELKRQASPVISRTDENYQTTTPPRRGQSPFLSALDR